MYIPELLTEKAEEIRALNVDEQPVEIDRRAWEGAFPELGDLFDGIPGGLITRRALSTLAPADPDLLVECTREAQANLKRFFILVMIWGYGTVNTGPWRVRKMISSPGFPAILCTVGAECFQGMFLKAYETLINGIDRLGPAFGSKYLYFFARDFRASVKPLILDSVVIKSMRTFNWPQENVDYIAHNRAPRNGVLTSAKGYGQYLILTHNWATALNCRPEQIEYFLWKGARERRPNG